MILEAKGITKRFGGLVAVNAIDLKVEKGEMIGIIGPNGSGKTTLVNCITGFLKPNDGKVLFDGKDVTSLPMYRKVKMGIGRTFQVPELFPMLTVEEHLRISLSEAGLKDDEIEREIDARVSMIGLRRGVTAKDLPFGDKKKLALICSVTPKTKIVFLDEVVVGLSPEEQKGEIKFIRSLQESGVAIVWIEHLLHVLLNEVNRVIVMNQGRKIMEGPPEKVVKSKEVLEVYVGEPT
jgi:branched-chain amino acid transport system ATP-binding protein